MPKKKIYSFVCWTKDVVDVEVEADSRREAEEKLQEMYEQDEIRWENAMSVDGGHHIVHIEKIEEKENGK